ncbi:DUF6088 family protein [Salipiger mucosus]|uniref:Transcriptional regulator, AbiEi antitoxin, Type IV TA system n=1 Tax=Salipiger mucosus DSM 16094 TaxID=1123237 RepID=S9RVR9_9RHOB|nr:DUF6088 family protein [Salipiger mucosus]EPX78074.1 hypothetical protein Salmuc_03396 [Salipiger mucosus DSM 16094]
MTTQLERLTEKVLAHARALPEGAPVTAKGLLHLANRAAVDQTLSRLAKRGALLRASRGVYVLPVESRFGKRAPSVEKTLAALAEQRGERFAENGAMAANMLGFTTQVPTRLVYLTSGRARRITLGKQVIELRHAPKWQLALGNAKAGQIIRALAWVGPDQADAVATRLRGKLNAEERHELARVAGRMPGWLAGTVSRMAHA